MNGMDTTINVNNPERWFSVVAGAALAAYGLTRRSIAGLVVAGVGGGLVWRGATGHCHVYEAMGLSSAPAEGEGDNVSVPYGRGIRVEKSVTINRSPEDLYGFWRNFQNLPRFMSHLKSVSVLDDKRSHWVAKGPAGSEAEWDAEIINEVPNELIGWRSVDGSQINNAGSVHFTRTIANRGTEVKVILRYDPPGGVLGAVIAKLFGEDPARQVQEDLRTLKQILETGERSTAARG
ncbi:MAG TPA: SRPBCC family protein [Thermoanaerobaculia bacterium]|nr:SRPBCC family protein [Thermoanaerobaculia bacterium]